jgi:hypothetical protein
MRDGCVDTVVEIGLAHVAVGVTPSFRCVPDWAVWGAGGRRGGKRVVLAMLRTRMDQRRIIIAIVAV